jgi:hypothetical protein
MKVNKNLIYIFVFVASLFFGYLVNAASLSGRILLQVESHGEAWYVNPLSNERYYLGRPDDAFSLMRRFGLGVKTTELNTFLANTAPIRSSGRILLQVEDKGQAYYVNPVNLKLYYLGRPSDAFNVMRELGLGITNHNLAQISIAFDSPVPTIVAQPEISEIPEVVNPDLILKNFSFKYLNEFQSLSLYLSSSLYEEYSNSPKVLTYLVSSPPPSLQEAFYEMFLEVKSQDNSLDEIISSLKQLASSYNLNQDELAELTLAFVQYIPYDSEKASSIKIYPYYPYETLYLNKGVCSDKTFLAYLLLQKLGFGVAILDFPEANHSALGLACEAEYSVNSSGYCYGETTNYFPIGIIPQNISEGQAQASAYDFTNLFSSDNLGEIEIYNKTTGKLYFGIKEVRNQVAELAGLYDYIINNRPQAGATYEEVIFYNQKVDEFNNLMSAFYQK